MPADTHQKHLTILNNIFQSTSFMRQHDTKPRVFLLPGQDDVTAEMTNRNLEGIGAYLLKEFELFNIETHPNLHKQGVNLNDLNQVVKRLRQYGMVDQVVVIAKAPPHPRKGNNLFMLVSTNWDTFNSRDYAFECRDLIISQEKA